MAPRTRTSKRKSTSKKKKKKTTGGDPLFAPIKAKIEAARNKLRVQAKVKAKRAHVHKRYLKLNDAHELLGFGPLDNIGF